MLYWYKLVWTLFSIIPCSVNKRFYLVKVIGCDIWEKWSFNEYILRCVILKAFLNQSSPSSCWAHWQQAWYHFNHGPREMRIRVSHFLKLISSMPYSFSINWPGHASFFQVENTVSFCSSNSPPNLCCLSLPHKFKKLAP